MRLLLLDCSADGAFRAAGWDLSSSSASSMASERAIKPSVVMPVRARSVPSVSTVSRPTSIETKRRAVLYRLCRSAGLSGLSFDSCMDGKIAVTR